MTDIEQLKQQIQVVARARMASATAIDIRAIARTQWETEHKDLEDTVSATYKIKEAEEAKLRELTLQVYAETGNKAPVPGVSIKIFEVLSYNLDEAMKWALEHRVALKLDTPVFEKIAKVDKPNFVTITGEARAQVARDLSLD